MDRLKKLIADAGRVLAHEGQGDYVAGHVSLRLKDDPSRFLMKSMAIDTAHHRLFSGCRSGVMAISTIKPAR